MLKTGQRLRPETLEDFLRLPTYIEWEAELADGWNGPDGSSSSLDRIFGVLIGATSRAFLLSRLPANMHDWRYRLSRRCGGLPKAWRQRADLDYARGCVTKVRMANLKPAVLALALGACWNRYAALRLAGGAAWTV